MSIVAALILFDILVIIYQILIEIYTILYTYGNKVIAEIELKILKPRMRNKTIEEMGLKEIEKRTNLSTTV